MQHIAHGGVHILHGTVAGLVDGLAVWGESHPVVRGDHHIAQRGVVATPFDDGVVLLVSVEEGTAVDKHQHRAAGSVAVFGLINVHLQVQRL